MRLVAELLQMFEFVKLESKREDWKVKSGLTREQVKKVDYLQMAMPKNMAIMMNCA